MSASSRLSVRQSGVRGYALDPLSSARANQPPGGPGSLTRARPGCGRPPGRAAVDAQPCAGQRRPELARAVLAEVKLAVLGVTAVSRNAPQVRTDRTSRSFAASPLPGFAATAFPAVLVGPGRRCRSSVLRGRCPHLNDPPGQGPRFASAGSLAGTPASRARFVNRALRRAARGCPSVHDGRE